MLIAQDLWQAHYQILSVILLREFIILNVNTNMIIKKCKTSGIKYKYCDCCLELTNVKDNLIVSKNSLIKTSKSYLVKHAKFASVILINVFCY